MQSMDRRTMLCAIAAVFVAATSRAVASAAPVRWKIPLGKMPAPAGVLTRLPGDGNQMALTVDDGVSVEVVGAFAQFAHDTWRSPRGRPLVYVSLGGLFQMGHGLPG
jgi:peptidoglycan-N-acetylglucosamine deacetylase